MVEVDSRRLFRSPEFLACQSRLSLIVLLGRRRYDSVTNRELGREHGLQIRRIAC